MIVTYDHKNIFIVQATDHFPGWLHWPGAINKDPPVWLDGSRSPPKYIFKNNMSSTNSKIQQTLTANQFYPCPIFVSKDGAYLSGYPYQTLI